MKLILHHNILALAAACLALAPCASGATAPATNTPAWLTRPLSLGDCLDTALQQNGAILRSKADVMASFGIEVQTRAIALPKVRGTGLYQANDADTIETFPSPFPVRQPDQTWSLGVKIVQSVYEGGRIESARRVAQLTKEQALLLHQTVIADTLLAVRVAYDDLLLAAQQIIVQEASVNLLKKELEDTTRRFEAGTVPRFNVLRAEVELSNAKPRLIRSKNAQRIAKNNLVNLLGFSVPPGGGEEIPLQLSGKLDAEPYQVELPSALVRAWEGRTELATLRKSERLRYEAILNADAGRKPSAQLFAGYGARNSSFSDNPGRAVYGWNAGAQVSWDIFDGRLTQGKVDEARALHIKSRTEIDDTMRRIELEVRTAYSNFIEAKEVLESQKKVQESAEEALRLANARADAGTGTQLDVLNAQTALTEARTTQIVALHDYSVARARLERAVGVKFGAEKK